VSVRSYKCVKHLKHRAVPCTILLLSLLASAFAKEFDEKVNLETQADSLYNHAQQLCASYSYDKALEILKQAIEIETKIGGTNRFVSITTTIGQIYFSTSFYDSAIIYYDSALKTARAINDRQTICSVLNDLGATYEGCCEYDRALAYCDTAILIAREIDNPQKIGQAFCTMGTIYYAMSEYEKARIYCDSALKMSESINDRAEEAVTPCFDRKYLRRGRLGRPLPCVLVSVQVHNCGRNQAQVYDAARAA
jgi:tetratricopeptide (TPR) repeat protein